MAPSITKILFSNSFLIFSLKIHPFIFKKKSLPNLVRRDYMNFTNHLSKLTYLFCLLTERFGTFNPAFARLGCQGFNGRVPLPFLISLKKN